MGGRVADGQVSVGGVGKGHALWLAGHQFRPEPRSFRPVSCTSFVITSGLQPARDLLFRQTRFFHVLTIILLALTTTQAQTGASSGFTIAGIVRSSVTNQPIAAGTVVIAPATARSQSRTFTTLQDGRFSFEKLPRGKYSIAAQAKGYRLQGWNEHDVYATAIVAGPGLDSQHIDFRLQPDASIEGRVTDDQNEPVGQAVVRLFRRDNEQGEQRVVAQEGATSDDEGYFRLGHLAPGTYFLAVSARPWYAQNYRNPIPAGMDAETAAQMTQEQAELDKAYPLTFYANALDSSGADPIVLTAGEHFTADIVLQAVNSVHLRIYAGPARGTGHAQSPFSVNLKQRIFDGLEDSVPGESIFHDEKPGGAAFVISGMAPGRYIVEVNGGGEAGSGGGWYQEVDVAGDTDITAGSASGFATVSGIIRFEDSDPPSGNVALYLARQEAQNEVVQAEISSKGEFSFPANQIRPGSYNVMLSNGSGFSLQKMMASGGTVVGRTLQIPSANTIHLAGIAARGIGRVDGVALRDENGIAGAMIVLVPDDPVHNQPLFRRDQSDSDGTFSLLNVVPGKYTVLAIADGWNLEWANPAVLQKYLNGGTKVQVAGGATLNVKVQVQ